MSTLDREPRTNAGKSTLFCEKRMPAGERVPQPQKPVVVPARGANPNAPDRKVSVKR